MKTVLMIASGVLAGVFAGALVLKVAPQINSKVQELAEGVKESFSTMGEGFKKGYYGEEYFKKESSL